MNESRPVAENWARTLLIKDFVLLMDGTRFELSDKGIGVQIKFPFVYSKTVTETSNGVGYIGGEYLLDGAQFQSIKLYHDF